MLETLITSKTRIKLLIKFFLNSEISSYLRGLESEFKDSTNAIRMELIRFEKAGLLISYSDSNKKYYKANPKHPLFAAIQNLIIKHQHFQIILHEVVKKIKNISRVLIVGDYPFCMDKNCIDLLFIGSRISKKELKNQIQIASKKLNCKITYKTMPDNDIDKYLKENNESEPHILWEN